MMYRLLLCTMIVALCVADSCASIVTYSFSGVSKANTILTPIKVGTPFSGSVPSDSSVSGTPNGNLIEYSQPLPPANLTIQVAGLTVQSAGDGLLTLSKAFTPAK